MLNAIAIEAEFLKRFGKKPEVLVRACGRINLIGEHTDYNEGFVLPAAVDKVLFYALAENGTDVCNFYAADIQEEASVLLPNLQKSDKGWFNYLQGIIQQFQIDGKNVGGVNVVFGGNLPIGAGVSSSAALECGLGWSLNILFNAGYSKSEIAQLAQRSSHQFVGVPTGIMDQFASLMGKENHFILLDCRSLEHRYISAALKDYQIVLINSNVHHELGSSEYPVRVAECKSGVQYLQQFDANIKSLRDVNIGFLEKHKSGLDAKIYRRCKYVITENKRVLEACDYLEKGNITKLGALLYETHEGLQFDYEVSCPEIDFLVDFTKNFDGVRGARLMGGGFGGCTINLVAREKVNDFVTQIQAAYLNSFHIHTEHYLISITDGTDVIELGKYRPLK